MLFTYLHLASSEELTRALLESGVTAVAYETVETDSGRLPLLEPMSEVAGRLATQIGAHCLESTWGGRGVLLGGVTGVTPAQVVIIGCGTVGRNAAQMAVGMGAQVMVLDIDAEKLRHVQETTHGNIITVFSTPYAIRRAMEFADLVIGAVLIPGARAPKLVNAEMVASMKPGAAIVDVAIDQGGCVETVRPTSHSQPTYIEHGVVHYAVPNMPALVPRSATHALTSCTLPYIMKIASVGLDEALKSDPALARGLNVRAGEITYAAVAEAFPHLAGGAKQKSDSG